MAAAPEALFPEPVDLRLLKAGALDDLLESEIRSWRRAYCWDYRPSADLVSKFADTQSLAGVALVLNRRPIGYTYYVYEETKCIIGGFYIDEPYDCARYESLLLKASIDAGAKDPGVRRVESQLMHLRHLPRRQTPYLERMRTFERDFMMLDFASAPPFPESRRAGSIIITPWHECYSEETSYLIAAAYQGHVDANINDQYRSPGGARRFLLNIIDYPGCGSFFAEASFVAFHADTGRAAGLLLASRAALDTGHVSQVCVSPAARREGVGYELMRRSLDAMSRDGCLRSSLTVTTTNAEAIHLYNRMGYRRRTGFAAMVWDGF